MTNTGRTSMFAIDDMVQYASVRQYLKTNYARMRRPAWDEKFLVSFPAYVLDMFRLSRRYSVLYGQDTNLLPYTAVKSDINIAAAPVTNWETPGFETVDAYQTAFPHVALLVAKGDAFYSHSFRLDFKPIVLDSSTSGLHPYAIFNRLLHRCIVQPGIVVVPYAYDAGDSARRQMAYGPAVLESAEVTGAEGGQISVSTNFIGATAVSGVLEVSPAAVAGHLDTPCRSSAPIDVVILIGSDADEYFDTNNLFRTGSFEIAASASAGALKFDIDRDVKRVVAWNLSVQNKYVKSSTWPSNFKPHLDSQEDFKSSDAAGTRYFSLEGRTVSGTVTFLAKKIDQSSNDLEAMYLGNNSDTVRMIVSIAPGYHFPLTNVQFSKGKVIVDSKKATRVTYNYKARLASNANIGMNMSNSSNSPTSEFGYAYSLDNNDFLNL